MYNWRSLTWSRAPHFDQGLTRVYPDEVDEGRILLNSSVAPFLLKKKTLSSTRKRRRVAEVEGNTAHRRMIHTPA